MKEIKILVFRDTSGVMISLGSLLGLKLKKTNEFITSLLMSGQIIVGRKTYQNFPEELKNSNLYMFHVISKSEALKEILKERTNVTVHESIFSAVVSLTFPQPSEYNEESKEASRVPQENFRHKPIYVIGGPMTYKEAMNLKAMTSLMEVIITTSFKEGDELKVHHRDWNAVNLAKFNKDSENIFSVTIQERAKPFTSTSKEVAA